MVLSLKYSVACTTEETKLLLGLSARQSQNPSSGSPHMYQDLSNRHDWPVKKAIVDLPIRRKRNSECISGINLLCLLGAQN